jgi:hypothetical protein
MAALAADCVWFTAAAWVMRSRLGDLHKDLQLLERHDRAFHGAPIARLWSRGRILSDDLGMAIELPPYYCGPQLRSIQTKFSVRPTPKTPYD